MNKPISRRTVLRGVGTALALPWLEAMEPVRAAGAADDWWAGRPGALPVRMAVVYVPNGVHMPDWTPAAEGADFRLPRILEPLAPHREDLLVLSGLSARQANGTSGNHARALAAFLTGRRPHKTAGEDIRLGVSADQLAARAVGGATRLPSLEIGCERGAQAGMCDTGYSCAYTSSISWKSETVPLPKETDPRLVFERLFGDPADGTDPAARARRRRSVLDAAREDAAELQGKLGADDRRKLDEYLTAVREVEIRLGRADAGREQPDRPKPAGVPVDYGEHIRLMCDMLVMAFRTDSTRISTFLFANEFSNRPYPFIGVPEGHHDLSHHGNSAAKQAKISLVNRFHTEQFAYLLGRLKAVREGDGTLLDRCMIAYGCGNSDGNVHSHDNLPILLAGRAGGSIKTGRHLRFADGTPLTNLWLSMLDRMGARVESLGDSTGRLLDSAGGDRRPWPW